jgi:hypothetical protein
MSPRQWPFELVPLASRQLVAALPSVRPNPSVKGTSCGKPQAAPYVER